ncbi:MAG: hypothetical protein H6647_09355 [Anaerolineales bacterium]|nr:hypothetical protein [Anaerolineales bacterium]
MLLLQICAQLQFRRVGSAHLQSQRLRDGRGNLVRVADRRQADEEDAVVELIQHVLGRGQESRVLPTPGGPTSVTSRAPSLSSRRRTTVMSCARPMSGVSWAGRLLGRWGCSSRALWP